MKNIIEELKNSLGEGYDVKEVTVEKNGEPKIGITVTPEGSCVGATVYLGEDEHIDELLERIDAALDQMPTFGSPDEILDTIREHIAAGDVTPKLTRRGEKSDDLIGRPFSDLFLSYSVPVTMIGSEEGTVTLKKGMDLGGVTEEDLYKASIKTLRKNLVFSGIEDILRGFLEGADTDGAKALESPMPMNVLTTKRKLYGAAQLIDGELLASIAGVIGDDLVIIPSSVHEVLVLPRQIVADISDIRKMINEVNETMVAPEEVLSDHPYLYVRGEGLKAA